jgi:hypothetical protein
MAIWKLCLVLIAGMAVVTASRAAPPDAVPVPAAVAALKGCWRGVGEVSGKRVVVALDAEPIVQGAMFVLEVESSAVADPKDRYSAHLVLGGGAASAGQPGGDVVGFWADSFGGAYTALGRGQSRPDGFDITYPYPGDDFVNRWTLSGDRLTWSIVARNPRGVEAPFASYVMTRSACRPAPL